MDFREFYSTVYKKRISRLRPEEEQKMNTGDHVVGKMWNENLAWQCHEPKCSLQLFTKTAITSLMILCSLGHLPWKYVYCPIFVLPIMGSMLPFTHMCYSSFQSQNRFRCSRKEKGLTSFKAAIFWPWDTNISCLACLLPFYLLCFSSWWLSLCLAMCVQQMRNITQFIAFIYYSPASLYFFLDVF